ncbi:MAG: type II secretion system F family protein [Rhizobiales bacterium]|nr:type II secretion system F family protein [Hyphomicrobiales bacterium]
MNKFRYSAAREDGERVAGLIEGQDRAAVIGRLGELGLHPIDVAQAEAGDAPSRPFSLRGGAASRMEITLFTRELAWLLKAGLTLNDGLDLLAREAFASDFSSTVGRLRAEIRKGRSFHDVLAEAQVFPPYYLGMVEVGEASGKLPALLEQIAITREREQRIRSRVVSALAYPLLLVALALGAVAFILVSIVPRIKDMIVGSGAPVPEAAQLVLGISDWMVANVWSLAIGVPAAALTIALLAGLPSVKALLLRVASGIPVLGTLLKRAAVVRFARVFATLAASGLTLGDSLRLVKPAVADPRIVALVNEMELALRRGEDFIAPLERSSMFPKLLARMLRVGNETGNLTASLTQISAITEEEFEQAVERSLTLLGPAIILALSGVVAFIIISLMSAILSLNDLAF